MSAAFSSISHPVPSRHLLFEGPAAWDPGSMGGVFNYRGLLRATPSKSKGGRSVLRTLVVLSTQDPISMGHMFRMLCFSSALEMTRFDLLGSYWALRRFVG